MNMGLPCSNLNHYFCSISLSDVILLQLWCHWCFYCSWCGCPMVFLFLSMCCPMILLYCFMCCPVVFLYFSMCCPMIFETSSMCILIFSLCRPVVFLIFSVCCPQYSYSSLCSSVIIRILHECPKNFSSLCSASQYSYSSRHEPPSPGVVEYF